MEQLKIGQILNNAATVPYFKYNTMLPFCSESTNGLLHDSSISTQRDTWWLGLPLRLHTHFLFFPTLLSSSSHTDIHTL